MPEDQKRQLYAATDVWFWPILWWNILRFEAFMASYMAEHGYREFAFTLSPCGQIKLRHISDAPKPRLTPEMSRATERAVLAAFTPDIVISAPVRTTAPAFAGVLGAWRSAVTPAPAPLDPG